MVQKLDREMLIGPDLCCFDFRGVPISMVNLSYHQANILIKYLEVVLAARSKPL